MGHNRRSAWPHLEQDETKRQHTVPVEPVDASVQGRTAGRRLLDREDSTPAKETGCRMDGAQHCGVDTRPAAAPEIRQNEHLFRGGFAGSSPAVRGYPIGGLSAAGLVRKEPDSPDLLLSMERDGFIHQRVFCLRIC